MGYETILYEVGDRVATIALEDRLNHPGVTGGEPAVGRGGEVVGDERPIRQRRHSTASSEGQSQDADDGRSSSGHG